MGATPQLPPRKGSGIFSVSFPFLFFTANFPGLSVSPHFPLSFFERPHCVKKEVVVHLAKEAPHPHFFLKNGSPSQRWYFFFGWGGGGETIEHDPPTFLNNDLVGVTSHGFYLAAPQLHFSPNYRSVIRQECGIRWSRLFPLLGKK